jgi:regulator of Ty1 transposition protein 103
MTSPWHSRQLLQRLLLLRIRARHLTCRTRSVASSRYGGIGQSLSSLSRVLLNLASTVGHDRAAPDELILTLLAELDKARGVNKTGLANSSIGGPALPSELAPLVTPAQNVSKLALSLKAKTTNAEQEYSKNTDPQPPPSAPVYAARLNGLLKTLATAEGAVAECVKARTELIGALEKLLDTNKSSLEAEEKQLAELSGRKSTIEQKKADVEMAIMRGLADQTPTNRDGHSASPVPEPDRPEVEALTPPPIEADADMYNNGQGTDSFEPVPAQEPAIAQAQAPQPTGLETLSSLASQYSAVPVSTNGASSANKRRKVDSADEIPDLGEDGIDPNIDEMIRQ